MSMTEGRVFIRPSCTITANSGTSKATGGIAISPMLMLKKARRPKNFPKATAYAAKTERTVAAPTETKVTRTLLLVHLRNGICASSAEKFDNVGEDGRPVGFRVKALFVFNAVCTTNHKGYSEMRLSTIKSRCEPAAVTVRFMLRPGHCGSGAQVDNDEHTGHREQYDSRCGCETYGALLEPVLIDVIFHNT